MPRSNSAPLFGKLLIAIIFAGWFAGGVYTASNAVWAAVRHWQSGNFPRVSGRVLESGVIAETSGDGGSVYRLGLRYAYEVDGTNRVGTVYRHQVVLGPHEPVSRLVASLPVGMAVDVFYDPTAPDDSLLKTGLDGDDLLQLLFAVPFNAIWILGAMAWNDARRRDSTIDHAGDRGETAGTSTTFWRPTQTAVAIAGTAAGLLVVSEAARQSASGDWPSISVGLTEWSIVVLAAAVGYHWRKRFLVK